MSTSVRRRTAMAVLALSLLGGGAALAANAAMLAPTADGGQPVIIPGKPIPTVSTIDPRK